MPVETPDAIGSEASLLAAQLAKKTAEAVKETGFKFDAEFDKEVESAIKRDDGGEPKPIDPKPADKPPVKSAKVVELEKDIEDIPEALLPGKKPGETKPPDQTEAEKQAQREKDLAEQTKGMSVKAADRFRAIEKRAWEAEQKASRLVQAEKELEQTKAALAGKVDSTEVDRLKKENERLDELAKKATILEHPRFRRNFDEQIEQRIAKAKELVPAEQFEDVESLLWLPESKARNAKLNEIIRELPDLERGQLTKLAIEAGEVHVNRKKVLDDWKNSQAAIVLTAQKEQEMAQAKRVAAIENAWKETEKRLKDPANGLELFREVDGNEEWNKTVKERFDKAKEIFSKDLEPEALSDLVAMAVAGPKYRELFYMQKSFNSKLKARLAELEKQEPEVRGGGTLTRSDEYSDSESFIDAVVRDSVKEGFIR